MILQKFVEITINNMNINHIHSKGYNCNYGDKIKVEIKDLKENSYYKIKVKCDICGKEKKLPYYKYNKSIKSYNKYACSQKCSNFKSELTKLEKYNDKYYNNREKFKKTNITKFGFEYPSQNEKIKEKIKKTFINNYGVEHPLKNENIKNKVKSTLINNYGENYIEIIHDKIKKTNNNKYNVNYPFENVSIFNKTKNKIKQIYNVDYFSQTEIWKNKNKKSKDESFKKRYNLFDIKDIYGDFLKIKCDKCHNIYEIKKDLFYNRHLKYKKNPCTFCNPIGDYFISYEEKQINKIISENYNGKIITGERKLIYPYHLDIYLPKLNLAFEYNGVYWHSDIFKEKNYHKNKSDLCFKKGVKLIHIWEDEWLENKNYILMLIKKILKEKKLNNNLKIEKIDTKQVIEFLKKNKIKIELSTENLALVDGEKIISILGFQGNKIDYLIDNYYNSLNLYLKYLNKDMIIQRCHFFNYNDINIIDFLKPKKLYLDKNKRIFEKREKSIHNSGYLKIRKK